MWGGWRRERRPRHDGDRTSRPAVMSAGLSVGPPPVGSGQGPGGVAESGSANHGRIRTARIAAPISLIHVSSVRSLPIPPLSSAFWLDEAGFGGYASFRNGAFPVKCDFP